MITFTFIDSDSGEYMNVHVYSNTHVYARDDSDDYTHNHSSQVCSPQLTVHSIITLLFSLFTVIRVITIIVNILIFITLLDVSSSFDVDYGG